MTDTLKAVASFSETGWKSMPRHPMDSVQGEHEVITAWADDAGDYGIGFDDVVTDVEWQKVDADTMAYRISGKVLLVIEWDYDGAPDGAGMSILSWHMGVER